MKGCCFGYPSQRDHDCLTMNRRAKFEVYFDRLLEKVDSHEANKKCLRQVEQKYRYKYSGNVEITIEQLKKDEEWKKLNHLNHYLLIISKSNAFTSFLLLFLFYLINSTLFLNKQISCINHNECVCE